MPPHPPSSSRLQRSCPPHLYYPCYGTAMLGVLVPMEFIIFDKLFWILWNLITSLKSLKSPWNVLSLYRALMKYGPLFTLSFLSIWFHWMHPSIQFVLCLCLYDGFLTMIDLNHLALLADLALSSKDRTNLNWYCSVFSGCGSLSVFLSHHFWDRDHMGSFHVFCTLLSAFSLVGFFVSSFLLKQHFSTTKVKIDIPQEKERSKQYFS